MPVTMVMRIQVEDFDAWLAPPDVVAGMFEANNALAYTLSRSIDDGNLLTVYVEFPDEETAHAFDGMYRKAAVERHDTAQEILEIAIGHKVESHSRLLA